MKRLNFLSYALAKVFAPLSASELSDLIEPAHFPMGERVAMFEASLPGTINEKLANLPLSIDLTTPEVRVLQGMAINDKSVVGTVVIQSANKADIEIARLDF